LRYILTFLSIFGLFSIPQILNLIGLSPIVFSSYSDIIEEFQKNIIKYIECFGTTFLIGFYATLISIFFGVLIGMVISYFNKFLGFFETTMKFIWSIPLIVVAVFMHLFINSEDFYVILTGVFLGLFPILSFTYKKCLEDDDRINNIVASFDLTRFQEFQFFRLPEVLKNLTIPLAQSVPLTYIGVTMGEWTVGGAVNAVYKGLGTEFRTGMDNTLFPKVYVSMILMMCLVYSTGIIFEESLKINKFIKKMLKRENKMRKIVFLFLLLFAVVILFTNCSKSSNNCTKDLILQLNWINDPTFTGEYIAKERSWITSKLNVNIKEGGSGINPIAMLLTKKAHFAVIGADKALIAISNGTPIKIVSIDLQRNPVGWIARQELKIVSFDEIKGREDVILGDKAGTETSAILKLVLERKNMTIKPKAVSFDFSYFITKPKVIYPVYLNEEPVKATLIHNIPIVEIDPAEDRNGGIKLYGNVVITSEEFFVSCKDIVDRFIEGLADGWEYANNNKEEALKIVMRYVKSDKEYLRQTMSRTIKMATDMYGVVVPPGHMEISAWKTTIQVLKEAELLKKDVNISKAIYLRK